MSYIDIRIPYEPGKQLGSAYNRAMETVEDWVLFLDHDVLLLNPNWYNACLAAIETVGHDAGWITCVTNRIGCRRQKSVPPGDHDDIVKHLAYAKQLWNVHGNKLEQEIGTQSPFSGFFILTHKKAWQDVGGFKDGFTTVDNDYHKRLHQAGYALYVMPGIYVYHVYTRKGLWKTF